MGLQTLSVACEKYCHQSRQIARSILTCTLCHPESQSLGILDSVGKPTIEGHGEQQEAWDLGGCPKGTTQEHCNGKIFGSTHTLVVLSECNTDYL